MMKFIYRRRLRAFIARIEGFKVDPLMNDYLGYHASDLDCVKWILAYYEGNTASTPKELLESILVKSRWEPWMTSWIPILYFWITRKRIEGF